MIVDGKTIAEEIYAELGSRISRAHLTLGLISAGESAVTRSFVNLKKRVAQRLGVTMRHEELSSSASTGDVIDAIAALSPSVNGLIVQLPLPKTVHAETVFLAMPSERDVDALNYTAPEKDPLVLPPVVAAILEILKRTRVEVSGKRTVVLGEGRLVGAPAATVLKERGANVSVVTRSKGNTRDLLRADIIVSGVGSPHLIKPEMIKDGVVLIDAGTSESGGSVVGDADPACAKKASVFTPVPGGVGPIAVAMIFKNLLALAEHGQEAQAL
ncbi:hypothetical protein A2673_01425 [Candidatus Kaiserbacteria bacterium RIFCSPHIGHO2_01_FULL_50_13]|nr:MAG: hypothetical protein A2673_01425 [Candidatus Kaiserbacteria bacterium RIFCSPHIGHO2_01_FULL_50_13]OGG81218.1 MAG: hypothetical protein A3H74_02130 [Candidatus Kaiserbacteria bacterium RIFCSPLOWO2_02_FULL_51_13]